MSWSSIYINGRNGFERAIRNRLGDSWLYGTSNSKKNLVVFWFKANTNLSDLKGAIGSNIISEYQLQFSADPDKFHKNEHARLPIELTVKEKAIIAEIEAWEKARSAGRPNGRATLDRHLMHLITNSHNDN